MSRYKKGERKRPVVVVPVKPKKAPELPPELIKTFHPRFGWIVRRKEA